MDQPSDPPVPRLRDITALPDLLHGSSRAGPVRERGPVCADLLPPCNAGCPAGENIQAYTRREPRYRALGNTNPAEAERLGVLAQEAVDQRWSTYEEMATRGAQRFPADARKDD